MRLSGSKSDIEDLREWLEREGFEVHTGTLIFNSEAVPEAVMYLTAVGTAAGGAAGLIKAVASYMEARKKSISAPTPEGFMKAEYTDLEELKILTEQFDHARLRDSTPSGLDERGG